MTYQIFIVTLGAVAGLATAGWLAWPKRRAGRTLEGAVPIEDMFAYTMYDDPC